MSELRPSPLRFDDVRVGDELPSVIETPTNVAVFLFGIAYWTSHRIHYDSDWAKLEGYDDVVVTGPLMNGWIVRELGRWAGDPFCLRKMRVRNVALTTVGETLEISGRVTDKRVEEGAGRVDCEMRVAKQDGTDVMTGVFTVQLPV